VWRKARECVSEEGEKEKEERVSFSSLMHFMILLGRRCK